VDQWEELYTHCTERGLRERFIGELLQATEKTALSIVITVRGDYYGALMSFLPLGQRLRSGVVNALPMTEQELLAAVDNPAAMVGLSIEQGLGQRILNDLEQEPGHLPLLGFLLSELWKRRHAGNLSHAAYSEIGGIRGAIARRADSVYGQLDRKGQEAARRLLIQLARIGSDSAVARQRIHLNRLNDLQRRVAERLATERLLVSGRDPVTGEESIEVAHEELLRRWDLLVDWLEQYREFLLWRQDRLGPRLREWQESGWGLLRDEPLALALRWLKEHGPDLRDEEREFIELSARQMRSGRRRRRLVLAAVAVVSGMVGLAGWLISRTKLYTIYRVVVDAPVEEVLASDINERSHLTV
jgi:hypothetical protein